MTAFLSHMAECSHSTGGLLHGWRRGWSLPCMVGPRVCSARRGKLNKHGRQQQWRCLKSIVSIVAICQSCAPGGKLEWFLVFHYCSTALLNATGGRKGFLKRMRRHWPSFHWKKLPVEAVHPVGTGIAAASARGLGSPNQGGSPIDCGTALHKLMCLVILASPSVTEQFCSCHFRPPSASCKCA